MRSSKTVDFKHDWKMVTILVGHNDLCSIVCQESNLDAKSEMLHVAQALDLLYRELPRTFINLMPIAGNYSKRTSELSHLDIFSVYLAKSIALIFEPAAAS